jgi:hypothetical protein
MTVKKRGAGRTADATYRKHRATILKDGPLCHWCKRTPATEADHLIPFAAGGADELENLVPSCKPCNARRGAQYKAARDRRRNTTPGVASKPRSKPKPSPDFFGTPSALPPRPSFSLSERKETRKKGKGHDLPRLETIVADAAGSFGPDVALWASKYLNIELMPWQRRVLDAQLSYDADGRFLNQVSLVSVARQNGKTAALKALVGWWLTRVWDEPQVILTTAHRLDLACALFQDLAPILEASFGLSKHDIVWAYGRNQIKVGGNKWIVRAAKPSAGHGLSCDLIIVDELFGVDTETLDIGLRPTQRARNNPLLSMWSTAGTEESVAMLKWREEALRAIDTGDKAPLYLAEYSPPPELDPMTPEAWEYANPALGHTLSIDTLDAESHAPNRAGFLRSSVNLWVQTETGWLSPGLWKERTTDLPPRPGGVLAVEVSVDDGRYCAVRCNHNAENILTATVSFMCDTLTAVWDHVRQEIAANPGLTLAITPTLDVHCPSDLARKRIIVGYREIVSFTGAVRQSIAENKLQHTGETMLAEHVGRAVAVRTPGAIALSSTKSPGPIELARCLVWAAGLMSKPRPNVTRPAIAFVRPNA